MNLSAIDLNLLHVLSVVLDEKSATRAAARLHVTQSAVSNALARLRVRLKDPLVTRTRSGLQPTPRALAMKPGLDAALAQLERSMQEGTPFNLATLERQWSLAFAEHYGPLLLPPLMERLRRVAPRTTLKVLPLQSLLGNDVLATGEVDAYVGIPSRRPAAWNSAPLFTDSNVCVMRKGTPAARRPLTLERFVALPHVRVEVTPLRGREVDEALAARGMVRRITLVVPQFTTALAVVAETDCVTVVPRRLAVQAARTAPLTLRELPFELPSLDVGVFWHRRADQDPEVMALVEQLKAAAGSRG